VPERGQGVEAGQLLALLKPNFYEAGARVSESQADFATAKAGLDQAETAYNRTKKLAAEQAKSARELQEVELAYQSAKVRIGGNIVSILKNIRRYIPETIGTDL